MSGFLVLASLLFGTLLLVACGGDSPDESATPTATMTVTATSVPTQSPTATLRPTPRPTSTPGPTATPPQISGRVVTNVTVSCDLGAYGPEIHVGYDSSVTNTADPAATLTRVRLYVDGTLRQDSGPLSHKRYVQHTTLNGVPGRLHTIQIHIETRAAPSPGNFIQFVQCPRLPDGSAA